MDFNLTEDQEMIRDSAKDFVETKCAATIGERDKNHVFDRALVNEMLEAGFAGA